MRLNSLLRDYLVFSKKERIALLFVLSLLVLVYLLPDFMYNNGLAQLMEDSILLKYRDSLHTTAQPDVQKDREDIPSFYELEGKQGFRKGEVFPFDPNTLDAKGWIRMGLPEKKVRTLLNYRNKGGRFYKKEDLKKIWALPHGFYEWVEPYIRIAPREKQNNYPFMEKESFSRNMAVKFIDINSADTAAWIALPGIGSRLAQRILSFRARLGGFYSALQVAETYGLPDSTFQKLRPLLQVNPEQIKKININTATKDDLKAHPYIRWNLANAIVEYRNQHGLYKDVSELKNIVLIDEVVFSKIAYYLIVE